MRSPLLFWSRFLDCIVELLTVLCGAGNLCIYVCCFCSQTTVRPEGEAGFEILDIFLSKVRRVPKPCGVFVMVQMFRN